MFRFKATLIVAVLAALSLTACSMQGVGGIDSATDRAVNGMTWSVYSQTGSSRLSVSLSSDGSYFYGNPNGGVAGNLNTGSCLIMGLGGQNARANLSYSGNYAYLSLYTNTDSGIVTFVKGIFTPTPTPVPTITPTPTPTPTATPVPTPYSPWHVVSTSGIVSGTSLNGDSYTVGSAWGAIVGNFNSTQYTVLGFGGPGNVSVNLQGIGTNLVTISFWSPNGSGSATFSK